MGNPKFTIIHAKDEHFYFKLIARNGETILLSQGYTNKFDCENGINSVKTNSVKDEHYIRFIASNGEHYFNLIAENGEVIGSSETYKSEQGRDHGIEVVKSTAPNAFLEIDFIKENKNRIFIFGAIIAIILLLITFVFSKTNQGEIRETSTLSAAPTKYAEIQTPIGALTITPKSSTIDADGKLTISYIDVGQGDAILIRSPEGLFALIDGGEVGSSVVQYLQSIGVQRLDLVVASHPHSDHIGGLIAVLNTFPVGRVVTNGDVNTTSTYENFLDAIETSKAEFIQVTRGDIFNLGSLRLNVLNPNRLVEGDIYRNSIVMRISYGITTFLFMGDATIAAEDEMIAANLPLKADILKVGHHGSKSSTSAEFLKNVSPAVSVYSVGRGNSFGLPNSDTINALSGEGSKIYGTDVNGTIVITVDTAGYSIQTERQGQVLPLPIVPASVPNTVIAIEPTQQKTNSISVVSLTSPISPNETAFLTIQTAPGASCSITVYYKSGASSAAGLGPQTANAKGEATWSWKVGSRTTRGTWRIVVQSKLGDKSSSLQIPFEVR